MSDAEPVDVVQKAYALFGQGNIEGLLELVDPEAEWHHPEAPEIPWAGEGRGKPAARRFFEAIASESDVEVFEPRAFLSHGSLVVVLGFERVRSRRTGKAYECHWAHAFEVESGKITSYREYTDTLGASAAFRA